MALNHDHSPMTYTLGTREAALQAMAQSHPNILALLDAFDHRTSSARHAFLVTAQHGPNVGAVSHCERLQ
jgi:hypothetical protein